MLSGRPVTVTYDSLPSNDVFLSVEPKLIQALPLKSLHWKPLNRPLRTIPTLPVSLRPFKSGPEDDAAHLGILHRPYLHLLFISCDDNEQYRTALRQQIRSWLDQVNAKRSNHDWLIVYVTTAKLGPAKFYQRKSTVLDKLKADFNTSKRDRCIQLALNDETAEGDTVADLVHRIKETVVYVFGQNVTTYEEDLRRLDSQRTLPGWNFCTFFIQKESLAFSFESMNLLEDALIQYDELEASFFQSMKESNLVWFRKLGGKALGDDSASILETTRKPYQDLIRKNEISIFDFRCYLFARQAALVIRLDSMADLCKRGYSLIMSLSALMRQEQGPESVFISSWVFSTCTELADKVGDWLKKKADDANPDLIVCRTYLAEFVDLARKQVEQIGMRSGHLPPRHPFIMAAREPPPKPNEHLAALHAEADDALLSPAAAVSQESILSASKSPSSFDTLYVQYCQRASQAYTESKKHRMAQTVLASLAEFERLRDNKKHAQLVYSQLSPEFSELGWKELEAKVLGACQELQADLGMVKEELLTTLALVRAGMRPKENKWMLHAEDDSVIAARLMKRISTLAKSLERDFAAVAFPVFAFQSLGVQVTRDDTQDGMRVSCQLSNYLPCDVEADEVRLKCVDQKGMAYWFLAPSVTLRPGTNHCSAFCASAFTGVLALDVFQIRISRIVFQYALRPSKQLPNDISNYKFQLQAHEDPAALRIYAEQHPSIDVDKPRAVLLSVHTGRNRVQFIDIRLRDRTNAATFLHAEASADDNASIELNHASTKLSDIAPHSNIRIRVPWTSNTPRDFIQCEVVADWRASNSPDTHRINSSIAQIPTGLPLYIKGQDYFRSDCIIQQFMIKNTSNIQIELNTARLDVPEGVEVAAARKPDAKITTIVPGETATFMFRCSRKNAAGSPLPDPSRFMLSYRTQRDFFLHQLQERLHVGLSKRNAASYDSLKQAIAVRWAELAVEQDDVVQFDNDRLGRLLARLFGEHTAATELAQIAEEAAQVKAEDIEVTFWRTISCPVEFPACHIFCRARLAAHTARVNSVGDPIYAELSIKTSFQWALNDAELFKQKGHRLMFYFLLDPAEWALVGQQRGEFHAKEGGTFDLQIHLIPLKAGSIPLPRISIKAVPPLNHADALPYSPTCEVQHVNTAERIDVMPNSFKSSTFWVADA